MKVISLHEFDNVTAAGILARTALSLTDAQNPAAQYKVPNERAVRAEILEKIRDSLGIGGSCFSSSDIEKIEEALDAESDRLLDPVDEEKALKDLSIKGELPTDLYDVSIDAADLGNVLGKKKDDEERLIKFTVQSPDRVQHLTLDDEDPAQGPLISLFAKSFENKFPNRNFTMLVTGFRQGLCVQVQQAWRVYSDFVSKPSRTLLDLLRRFAEEYGIEMDINGQKEKFFMNAGTSSGDISRQITLQFSGTAFVLSQFEKRDRRTGRLIASLLYAIDIGRYRRKLMSHGWNDEKLTDWAFPVGSWKKEQIGQSQGRQLA